MSNALTIIEQKLTSEQTKNKLLALLGVSSDNERGQQEVYRYASSVLAEVRKSSSDSKKDLTVCNPDSIVQSMIDAASFGLTIDGRQHAHLVKFGNNAVFQIGYRGYLAKIKEHYPDADFTVELIFDGDAVKIWNEDSLQRFTIQRGSDPFSQTVAKFKGVLFAVSYTDHGKPVQKVTAVTKERIDRARKAAKQDFIWNSDYFEKAKAAAIKNACKYMFASIQGLQEMIRYDNENNYDMNKKAEPTRSSIIDNINRTVAHEPVAEPEVIDIEIVEDHSDLIEAAEFAASQGVEEYTKWLGSLADEQKAPLRDHHKRLTQMAKKADEQTQEDTDGEGEIW
jgi:recombinational DNA repair protein RecT